MPPADDRLAFAQLVFSGGGTRCVWHGGFLEVVAPAIGLAPERVIGDSGGALSAAAFITGRAHELQRVMIERFEHVDSNLDLNAISKGESITPHQRIYRDPDRLYVAPSRETPADKIDFTDPEKVRRTWKLDRHDGGAFLALHGVANDNILNDNIH